MFVVDAVVVGIEQVCRETRPSNHAHVGHTRGRMQTRTGGREHRDRANSSLQAQQRLERRRRQRQRPRGHGTIQARVDREGHSDVERRQRQRERCAVEDFVAADDAGGR